MAVIHTDLDLQCAWGVNLLHTGCSVLTPYRDSKHNTHVTEISIYQRGFTSLFVLSVHPGVAAVQRDRVARVLDIHTFYRT